MSDSDEKEHHFFDVPYREQRGLGYYASSFANCTESKYTVDGTPDYLHTIGAAQTLARMYGPERLKRTTFVVILCEPVQRAQSAHYHFRYMVRGSMPASSFHMCKGRL